PHQSVDDHWRGVSRRRNLLGNRDQLLGIGGQRPGGVDGQRLGGRHATVVGDQQCGNDGQLPCGGDRLAYLDLPMAEKRRRYFRRWQLYRHGDGYVERLWRRGGGRGQL